MDIKTLQHVGKEVLQLLGHYHNPPRGELAIDAILYAYLRGRGYKISRQHQVRIYGDERPRRIDFRFGGSNPMVVEFAVRGRSATGALYGSQNSTELRKLCRTANSAARQRVLLLLDLAVEPLHKANLKATYDPLHAGRGRFTRNPVRVIYVHKSSSFHFLWRPYKQP